MLELWVSVHRLVNGRCDNRLRVVSVLTGELLLRLRLKDNIKYELEVNIFNSMIWEQSFGDETGTTNERNYAVR